MGWQGEPGDDRSCRRHFFFPVFASWIPGLQHQPCQTALDLMVNGLLAPG